MPRRRRDPFGIPDEPGVYALILEHSCGERSVRAGKRITVDLVPGILLVYVGSALGPGGLRGRIYRHLRREKRVRWHIDYLTVLECVRPRAVVYAYSYGFGEETCVAGSCSYLLEPGPYGFGASDDRRADTHLFYSRLGLEGTIKRVTLCFQKCRLMPSVVSSLQPMP